MSTGTTTDLLGYPPPSGDRSRGAAVRKAARPPPLRVRWSRRGRHGRLGAVVDGNRHRTADRTAAARAPSSGCGGTGPAWRRSYRCGLPSLRQCGVAATAPDRGCRSPCPAAVARCGEATGAGCAEGAQMPHRGSGKGRRTPASTRAAASPWERSCVGTTEVRGPRSDPHRNTTPTGSCVCGRAVGGALRRQQARSSTPVAPRPRYRHTGHWERGMRRAERVGQRRSPSPGPRVRPPGPGP